MDKQTSCVTFEECFTLCDLGGLVRPPFRTRDGRNVPAVVISRVLCPFCREYHMPAEVDVCMVLPRKNGQMNGHGSSPSFALVPGLLEPYSELWAFLTANTFPDGARRQTGRLSVSCDVDLLALSLTDAETGLYACLTGHRLDDLLAEAELRLEAGTMPWRPSRFKGKGK